MSSIAMTRSQLTTLSLGSIRGLAISVIFIIGNIVAPQLIHLIPGGGLVWLPIYFFTLIGAYKFGWKVGLLTAILSPAFNSMFFGMPVASMVPIIMIKGSALAICAAMAARIVGKVSLIAIALAVIVAQLVGIPIELLSSGSMTQALNDITVGLPGIAIQIVGGWLLILATTQPRA